MPDTGLRKRGESSKNVTAEKPGPSKSSKVKAAKDKEKEQTASTTTSTKETEQNPELPGTRFGPMPAVSKHRLYSRAALILGLMTVVYFSSGNKEEIFADSKSLKIASMDTVCSPEITKSSCKVQKCGRMVTDVLLNGEEIFALIDLARRGFISHPGVSVMDLGEKILKFDKVKRPLSGVFKPGDSPVFKAVKSKLQRAVSTHFGVDYLKLQLASPVFISMIKPGGKDISQIASHDKILSYTFSTIAFLTDHVKGGRLVFVDSDNTNRTVVPMQGRVVTFTSGKENQFFFEKMQKGLIYALFVGFTCDKGIPDPTF